MCEQSFETVEPSRHLCVVVHAHPVTGWIERFLRCRGLKELSRPVGFTAAGRPCAGVIRTGTAFRHPGQFLRHPRQFGIADRWKCTICQSEPRFATMKVTRPRALNGCPLRTPVRVSNPVMTTSVSD